MAYSQPTTIEMPMSQSHATMPDKHLCGWVIGCVLVGHLAVIAGLAQLEPKRISPTPPQPIEIRWVELAPPPPPPKVVPAPAQPSPSPKVVPIAPLPPVAKTPPTIQPAATAIAKPTAKPIAKPITQPVERVVTVVATPAPVLSTSVAQPTALPSVVAPVTPTAAPQSVAAQPVAATATPSTAPASEPSPRTVAIDGVSYVSPPKIRFSHRNQKEYDEIGQLLLDISVDATGKVVGVSIRQSSGNSRYDSAVSYAIKRTKFNPYRVDGIAQAFTVTAPFEFEKLPKK